MAKKNDKKAKGKKVTKPAAKKAAPKKAVKKSAPAAKKVKPAPKKAAPAKKAAAAKPAPKAKAKEADKKKDKKAASNKEKEVKKPIAAIKTKGGKEDSGKKVKPSKEELEGEGLELEEDMEGLELDAEGAGVDDDVLEEDEAPKQKAKGKRRRGKKDDEDEYDSENLIRKQALKIDLTKSLIKRPQGPQPKPFVNTSDNRTRYSDAELTEFKELILDKLREAEADYELLKSTLSNKDNHGTDDTSPTFKLLEDGSDVLSKEETAQLAARQEKYIISLRNALVRIENKSYGICRATGKLIPKERLRSVPHATLGIDAKLNQHSN